MELRSSRTNSSNQPSSPIMAATEVQSIAKAIAGLVIPTPPPIDSSMAFVMYFIPAFQMVLNSLSPGADHIYLYMFFPPATWTAAEKAIN